MVHISDLDIHSLHLHELRFGFIELAMLKVWHRTAEDSLQAANAADGSAD